MRKFLLTIMMCMATIFLFACHDENVIVKLEDKLATQKEVEVISESVEDVVESAESAEAVVDSEGNKAVANEENTVSVEGAYIVIPKSAGSKYNERMIEGFKESIEANGYKVVVKYPEQMTSTAQMKLIDKYVAEGVVGIAIAANDYNELETTIKSAMDKGVHCICVDAPANVNSRETYINQVRVEEVARKLIDSAYELMDGEGEWAIITSTPNATNQNMWLAAIDGITKEEKYSKMQLVAVVNGNDNEEDAASEAKSLIEYHPNLKLICPITTSGTKATAKVVKDLNLNGKVLLMGLGLPSDMAEYVVGDNPVCPYVYLWNPIELGKLAANTLIEMVDNGFDGRKHGSSFVMDGKKYVVEDAIDGGTQIVLGDLVKYDKSNIADWKDLY